MLVSFVFHVIYESRKHFNIYQTAWRDLVHGYQNKTQGGISYFSSEAVGKQYISNNKGQRFMCYGEGFR